MKQKEELATQKSAELATQTDRPAFVQVGDARGRESIGAKDVKPPKLVLAQSTSDQRKRDNPKYIKGLEDGFMFNDLDGTIYGVGPLDFVVIHCLGHRHIEFIPRAEGGGVKDFDVPDEDARTQFTSAVIDGKTVRVKPVATKFYDFVVMVMPNGDTIPQPTIMALSMSNTKLKVATRLNSLIALKQAPSFAGVYSLSAIPEKGKKGEYYNYRVEPRGWVSDEATFAAYGKLHEQFKTANVIIDHEEAAADDEKDPEIPF